MYSKLSYLYPPAFKFNYHLFKILRYFWLRRPNNPLAILHSQLALTIHFIHFGSCRQYLTDRLVQKYCPNFEIAMSFPGSGAAAFKAVTAWVSYTLTNVKRVHAYISRWTYSRISVFNWWKQARSRQYAKNITLWISSNLRSIWKKRLFKSWNCAKNRQMVWWKSTKR